MQLGLGQILRHQQHILNAQHKFTRKAALKKMWLAELIIGLKGKWADPVLSERPDLLIFIGYRPDVIDGMVAGLKRIHSVHLGPGKSRATNQGVEAVNFSEWGSNLDELVKAI